MEVTKKKGGCLRTLGLMFITVVLSVVVTVWVVNYYIFPKQFDSVELNRQESGVLDAKLKQFGLPSFSKPEASNENDPEKYSEVGAKREINFTEKELNALLAKNTDLSEQLSIDLSENLASAKAIIPLDPDFPILGGKTIKVSAGMELAYANGKPVVILKGVSVWGIPIPNAWLGNLKNVDLIQEFGGDEGFWKSFSEGVEHIRVAEGMLNIKLKE